MSLVGGGGATLDSWLTSGLRNPTIFRPPSGRRGKAEVLKILGSRVTSHGWGWVVGWEVQERGDALILPAEFHTALCRMGCTNWGLT